MTTIYLHPDRLHVTRHTDYNRQIHLQIHEGDTPATIFFSESHAKTLRDELIKLLPPTEPENPPEAEAVPIDDPCPPVVWGPKAEAVEIDDPCPICGLDRTACGHGRGGIDPPEAEAGKLGVRCRDCAKFQAGTCGQYNDTESLDRFPCNAFVAAENPPEADLLPSAGARARIEKSIAGSKRSAESHVMFNGPNHRCVADAVPPPEAEAEATAPETDGEPEQVFGSRLSTLSTIRLCREALQACWELVGRGEVDREEARR